jgi:hypothetical protein
MAQDATFAPTAVPAKEQSKGNLRSMRIRSCSGGPDHGEAVSDPNSNPIYPARKLRPRGGACGALLALKNAIDQRPVDSLETSYNHHEGTMHLEPVG